MNKIGIWQCKWTINNNEYLFEESCDHRIHIRQMTMRITYKASQILGSVFFKSKQHRSKVYGTDIEYEKKKGIKHQFGYYQTSKYIEKLEEKLGKIRIETLHPTKWYLQVCSQIESSQRETVGLHIRRSDYLENKSGIGLLKLDYFRSICEEIASGLGSKPHVFLVFTDDEVELQNNFLIDNMRIVNTPAIEPPINVMLLLARCDVLVMSNSTFSWWASYIGQSQFGLKRVVCPEPWFKEKIDPLGIYRKTWERRESNWEV